MDVVSNEQIVLAAAKGLVDVDSLEIVKVEDYAHEWEVVYRTCYCHPCDCIGRD